MSAAKRGLIIAQRRDRLGARLLTLLNAMRIAQDYGTAYRVNWFPKGADAPELATPEDLFKPEWIAASFIDGAGFEKAERDAKQAWEFQNDPTPAKLERHLKSGHALIVEEGFSVFTFAWENAAEVQSRYRDFIHQIGFTDALCDQMSRIDRALAGNGSTAYHVRRGDILTDTPWKHATWTGKIEPDEYYTAHMEGAADTPAIVFSDQPETVAKFKARFPDLLTMTDITDVSGLTRARRDFLEMYAMSRAQQVIAPNVSAFSIAAARLAGSERLTFAKVLTPQAREKADAKLLARLKEGPDAFLNPSEAAHIYARVHQTITSEPEGDQAAYDIAAKIMEAGADNAFLPVLQALNCLYLERLGEGANTAAKGLGSPDLWPDEWASLKAITARLLGAQGKRRQAGAQMADAFWAKPLRPDVVLIATAMLRRNQLAKDLFPPIDWDVQRSLVRPFFPPFQDMFVVARKIVRLRPCNFDMILLDWHALCVDQKARRILGDRSRLKMVVAWQDRVSRVPPHAASRRSLAAMLDFRLGCSDHDAVTAMQGVLQDRPEKALYHKRLADIYDASGSRSKARDAMTAALDCAPDCPFMRYALGDLLIRQKDTQQGEAHILRAADISVSSDVAIQGEAGHISLRNGDYAAAVRYLGKAHRLHPTHPRFANQLKRAQAKL